MTGTVKPPIVLSSDQTTSLLDNNIENKNCDSKAIENPYYEGISDTPGTSKHKSEVVVNLDEIEKVTTTENVHYKL